MSEIIPNVVVSMPSQLFTMARSFKACTNGRIYIGKIDTDPTLPENQIQVYLERQDGAHIPCPQPIIINQAGYPVYAGQISKFVTVEGHSMAVYDSYGAQQFYFPNVLKYEPDRLRFALMEDEGANLIRWSDDTVGNIIDKINEKADELTKTGEILDMRISKLDSEIAYSNEYESLAEWASDNKKYKVFVEGSYDINETLNINREKLSTNGKVIINANFEGNAINLGKESIDLVGTTRAILPRGGRTIAVNSGLSLSTGDEIAIIDQDNGSYHKARDYYHKGEFFTVSDINGNKITTSNPSNDDYRSGCIIYKVKISKIKEVSGDFVIINKSNISETRGAAILIAQSFNSKLSNLKIDSVGYSSSLSIKNCKNLDSENINISNRAGTFSLSETDYAVVIANSERINLNGVFLSDRHSVAHGGFADGAMIVNRFCHHSGKFMTSGLGQVSAADFHANTESCSFSGYINGVSLGGHNNSITHSLIEVPISLKNLPAVLGAEMKSINHDISYNQIITNGNPDLILRGVVDFGGNAVSYDENSDFDGMLRLNNNFISCPESKTAVRIVNRGSLSSAVLNISNNFIINNSSSETSIRVQNLEGINFRAAIISGCIFTPNTKTDISGCDEIIM